MAVSQSVPEVKVEDYVFPPTVKAPGSDKPFFLGGAGVREIEIPGKFIKVTAIGVYLEECAISSLAPKWKGKIADELVESDEFFRDIITGPFEKFLRVTLILPLTGQQYSEKVIENCVKAWKSHGVYTDKEAKAIEKFSETFKDENFPPGNSVMFTQSPLGTLTIAFSKHDSTPETGIAVIENKNMAEAVIESTIGKHGGKKQTIGLSQMAGSQAVTVEGFVFPPTVKAPGSDKHFIFGGAGVRGVEIPGKIIKVTTMAIYLEEGAIPVLSAKWKGKTADELAISDEFFQDIVSGPFEKLLHVSFLVPMTGPQYSEKVSEHCVETWKTDGIYTDKEAKAIQKFLDTFKDQQFPPGHSIFYTLSHLGSLTIAFSKHDSIPEAGVAVIESNNLVEVITDSSIGKTSVSPDTKKSLAAGVSQLLNNN